MSPLTKLFVVLLVLVSIALSAGTITFVNKLDPLQAELKTAKSQLLEKETLLNKKSNDAAAALQSMKEAEATHAAELATLRGQVLTMRSTVEDRDAQIARTNNNLAVLTSANNSQSTAVAASEESKSKLQEQVTGLRKDADDRLRQVADLGQRVSSLVAQLDQTERARKVLAEQLTDASSRADQQAKMLQDMGVTTAQIQRAGTGAGAPALNGVISDRRNIAGKEYATISIGASDYVTTGMQFKILDAKSGAFLGLLKVEIIDEHAATGQISAEPQNLAQIKAGNVVKTQI